MIYVMYCFIFSSSGIVKYLSIRKEAIIIVDNLLAQLQRKYISLQSKTGRPQIDNLFRKCFITTVMNTRGVQKVCGQTMKKQRHKSHWMHEATT